MTPLYLSAPSPQLAQWLTWPWPPGWVAQALDWPSAAACVQTQGGLWVLQPDDLAGPGPEDLARFWAAPTSADPPTGPERRLLVLLPPARWPQPVAWLDAGADRCLPGDSPRELVLAQARALQRRLRPTLPTVFGPLRYDHSSRTLWADQQRVALTRRETQLLHVLMQAGLRLVPSADIVRALGDPQSPSPRRPGNWASLHVHRLNRKLQPHGVKVEWVQRLGYGLRLLASSAAAHPTGPHAGWADAPAWPPRAALS